MQNIGAGKKIIKSTLQLEMTDYDVKLKFYCSDYFNCLCSYNFVCLLWFHLFHQVTAVVIYNCPTTKSLGLSLSKFHQKATFDPEDDLIGDLSQGDIIDEAVVVRVQKKTSVIVQLNQKTKGIIYVSKNMILKAYL